MLASTLLLHKLYGLVASRLLILQRLEACAVCGICSLCRCARCASLFGNVGNRVYSREKPLESGLGEGTGKSTKAETQARVQYRTGIMDDQRYLRNGLFSPVDIGVSICCLMCEKSIEEFSITVL